MGTSNTGVDFGGGARTSVSSADMYVVKLGPDGCYLWDKFFGGTSGFEQIWGLDTDDAGNVYAAGYFRGTMDLGGGPRTNNQGASTTNYDLYVVKYSPTGAHVWDFVSTGDGSCLIESGGASGIDVFGPTGEVAVAGRFNRSEVFGPFTIVNAAGATSTAFDPFVMKLNASGTPAWVSSYTMSTSSEVSTADSTTPSICLFDPAGDVYYASIYMNGANIGAGALAPLVAGGQDAFLTRRSGATGAHVWSRTIRSSTAGTEVMGGLSVDAGRLYLAGGYYSGTDFGSGARTAGGRHPFVAAYDRGSGAYLWDRAYTSSSTGLEQTSSVRATGTQLFAGGMYAGTADFGGGPRTSVGGVDAFLLKLDPATGATIWDKQWGGSVLTALEQVRSVATTPAGDPTITGSYVGTVDWDPGAGTTNRTAAGSLADYYLVKLQGATGNF
ncbi:MAG TPA: hypothetical protein VEI97_14160 [bacterium]|nr:hypothetical protein [bacterium]